MSQSQKDFLGFIVGEGRSGTTLFSAMLNRHSRVCVTPETHFYRRLSNYPKGAAGFLSAYPESLRVIFRAMSSTSGWTPDPEPIIRKYPKIQSLADIRLLFLQMGDEIATQVGKPSWLEKTPNHIRNIPLIDRLHPNQRVICIVRDGRAVAESLTRMDWASNNYIENCLQWAWTMRLYERFLANRENTLTLRYEDLVINTVETLKCACDFLDICYEPSMLEQSKQDQDLIETGQQHKNKIMGAVDPSNIELWRNQVSPETIKLAENLIGYELRKWDYELDHPQEMGKRRLFVSTFQPSPNTHSEVEDITTELLKQAQDIFGSGIINIGEKVVNPPDYWLQFEELMPQRFSEHEGASSNIYLCYAVINLIRIALNKKKRLVLYYHPNIYNHCTWRKKRFLIKLALKTAWKVILPDNDCTRLEERYGVLDRKKTYSKAQV